MTADTLATLALVAAAVGVTWLIVRRSIVRISERRWLPAELRRAQLAFAEKTFRIRRPVSLIARVDRVYRLNQELHLLEFKTRRHSEIYPSDVVELSAQRLTVEMSTGARVSDLAYVLVQHPHGRRRYARKVDLLHGDDIFALMNRRDAILSGDAAPRYTQFSGLCRECAYRDECKSAVDRGQRT